MNDQIRPYLLTFISTGLVVIILGFAATELALLHIENQYIELQLDVNRRYAENTTRILEKELEQEKDLNKVLATFQQSIENTSTERGFVCILDNNSSKLVCHPNPEMVGMSVNSEMLEFQTKIRNLKTNKFSTIVNEGIAQGGQLNYLEKDRSEIAFMVPVPGTDWMVSVHENLGNIKQEINNFRTTFYTGASIIGFILALGVTFAARLVSKRFEIRILSLNKSLEKKVRERTQELVDAYYKIEKANEELSKLDRTKSDFLLLINHEMRTPLNGIIGMTDVLEDSDLTQDQVELIKMMKVSNNRLLRFVEASLLLTELKTSGINTQLSEINIKTLIDTVINKHHQYLQNKGIKVEQKLCEEHTKLVSNKNLIEKCLGIILDNAIRFSPENSTIRLLTYISKDSHLNINIDDQGPGFSDEAIEKLFKFFASDNIKHHSEGLGLGLATVKLIMDSHNGQIAVKNIRNKGARVKLSLPIRKEDNDEKRPETI